MVLDEKIKKLQENLEKARERKEQERQRKEEVFYQEGFEKLKKFIKDIVNDNFYQTTSKNGDIVTWTIQDTLPIEDVKPQQEIKVFINTQTWTDDWSDEPKIMRHQVEGFQYKNFAENYDFNIKMTEQQQTEEFSFNFYELYHKYELYLSLAEELQKTNKEESNTINFSKKRNI